MDNEHETLYGSKKTVVVEGETPAMPESSTAGSGLTTTDLASAGEQKKLEDTRRSEAGREVPVQTPTSTSNQARADSTPLFASEEAAQLRSRWDGIQVGFVDEPRHAVEEADELVAFAVKRLAQIFADERTKLEQQWSRGDQVSTEDLRVALQRYRSFFSRLLSV